MGKLLALLILLVPGGADGGSDSGSVQADAGVAQKAQSVPDCKRGRLGKCWWDADAGYCQDTRVERLGFLNARPPPEDWGRYTYYAPPVWGTYPQEAAVKAAREAPPERTTCE